MSTKDGAAEVIKTFTHDLTALIRNDLALAEQENPGTKFTVFVEMLPELQLKVTVTPETKEVN